MKLAGRIADWTNAALEKTLGVQFHRVPVSKHAYGDLRRLRDWSPQDVIFDVGANDGRSVFRMQEHLPSPSIFAFEPVSTTFRTLVERTAGLDNVRCFQLAMGAKPGSETIYLQDIAAMNSFDPHWGNPTGSETVVVSTVDQVMSEHDIDVVHFLKIDTEGYELEVLKGAQEALASSRIKIIQLETGFDPRIRSGATLHEFQEYLAPMGYYLRGIYNQCHNPAQPPVGWNGADPAEYKPRVLSYCDALFVSA